MINQRRKLPSTPEAWRIAADRRPEAARGDGRSAVMVDHWLLSGLAEDDHRRHDGDHLRRHVLDFGRPRGVGAQHSLAVLVEAIRKRSDGRNNTPQATRHLAQQLAESMKEGIHEMKVYLVLAQRNGIERPTGGQLRHDDFLYHDDLLWAAFGRPEDAITYADLMTVRPYPGAFPTSFEIREYEVNEEPVAMDPGRDLPWELLFRQTADRNDERLAQRVYSVLATREVRHTDCCWEVLCGVFMTENVAVASLALAEHELNDAPGNVYRPCFNFRIQERPIRREVTSDLTYCVVMDASGVPFYVETTTSDVRPRARRWGEMSRLLASREAMNGWVCGYGSTLEEATRAARERMTASHETISTSSWKAWPRARRRSNESR